MPLSFYRFAVGTLACAVLGACSSLSGYDAQSNFSCKAPDGVLCQSMSGIYANAQAHNLPGQQVKHDRSGDTDAIPPAAAQATEAVMTKPIYSGTPIRSAPYTLRIWVSPWEDADGDLHDQSYVYVMVNNGEWLIEHNRRRIQQTYQPVRAPRDRTPSETGTPTAAGTVGAGGVRQAPMNLGGQSSPSLPNFDPNQAANVLRGLLPGGLPGQGAEP
jgi:conjugal transfer pilus assembly protein TraV